MDSSETLRQAISELRDLVVLSERAIEKELGGVLPLSARHELSSAIGRAFEVGSAYGKLAELERQNTTRTTPPPEGYDDDYVPPPTPYIGHPAARRGKGSNGKGHT